MGPRNTPLPVKVAIYDAMLRGESGRSVASRFDMTHPTAIRYAQEAVLHLRGQEAVAADSAVSQFLAMNLRIQCFTDEVEAKERVLEIIEPMLKEVADLVQPGERGPTVTVSARIPETVFYQFRRLAAAEAERRATDVTISGLLSEILEQFVETGKVPVAKAGFKQSDLIMDEIRTVLAKYGIARE